MTASHFCFSASAVKLSNVDIGKALFSSTLTTVLYNRPAENNLRGFTEASIFSAITLESKFIFGSASSFTLVLFPHSPPKLCSPKVELVFTFSINETPVLFASDNTVTS
jgi:hypothetical protein